MRTLLPLIVALSLLLSSCASATQTVIPITTPEITLTSTSTATPTATALMSATATPTISPDPMIYQFDSNISAQDQAMVKQGVQMARYYLMNNFGSDIKDHYVIKVINDPNSKQPEGHTDVVNGKEVFTENVGHPGCVGNYPQRCLFSVIFETTHLWQSEQGKLWPGCFTGDNGVHAFLVEGQSGYVADMALGIPISDGQALVFWQHSGYDENALFDSNDGGSVAVKHLVDQYGALAFTKYCTNVGNGMRDSDAFQSAFGISIQDFRTKFKENVLGNQKDCTVTTCGASLGHEDPRYGTLTPVIDYSLSSPNLTIKIIDKAGTPVPKVNLQLFRRLYNDVYYGTGGEDNGTNSEGILSAPVLPGTYAMRFCVAGYLIGMYSVDTTKCVYELKPFEVLPDEAKTIDFQYWDIQNPNLTEPNFLLTLLGVDGKILVNQYVQVCGSNAISTVCLNGKTDDSGIFRASLNAGTYTVRLVQPGQGDMDPRGYANPKYGMNLDPYHNANLIEYQIPNIQVDNTTVKSMTYQFPSPNLKIEFLDINGSPIPNTYFYLCKSIGGSTSQQDLNEKAITNQILSVYYSNWNSKTTKIGSLDGDCILRDHTDKQGIFQYHVDPENYFLYFDNPGSQLEEFYFDHDLSSIKVTGDQLTTVSYQFK